jgi:DNA ligase (NAD+)
MNIDGFGDKIVRVLYKENILKNIKDIYLLDNKREDILSLEGFKDKRVDNLLSAINNSKDCTLNKFIFSLGIEQIGEVASKRIASLFGKDFLYLSKDKLLQIDSFGESMIDSLLKYICDNKIYILELMDVLNIKEEENIQLSDTPISGKSIVITGTFAISRDEIKKQLENLGAKISSSVSKKTDFVLCGQKAGSKQEKAEKLDIQIIDMDFIDNIKQQFNN